MEHYLESGVFDSGEGVGLQPEEDETTFNGFIWRRARETFWANPDSPPPQSSAEYQRAVQYYREQAVPNDFRWSWRNAQLEHDLFRRTISGSNDSFRRSVADLGVILGNHVLSLVDAFVSFRIGPATRGERGAFALSGSMPIGSAHAWQPVREIRPQVAWRERVTRNSGTASFIDAPPGLSLPAYSFPRAHSREGRLSGASAGDGELTCRRSQPFCSQRTPAAYPTLSLCGSRSSRSLRYTCIPPKI
jgi:hypothetical protein